MTAPTAILIVDDDRGLLRLLEKSLSREGFATATAGTGQEAVAWLRQHRVDLLLLDLHLADMPGWRLLERLRQERLSAPFLVITGQGDERAAVEMMKQGALDYVVKDGQFLMLVPALVNRACQQLARERRLEAMEQQVRLVEAAVQQAGDAVVITSAEVPDPTIVYVNPAFVQLTGWNAAELVGQKFAALRGVIKHTEGMRQAFARGHFAAGESTITPRSGPVRSVEWQLAPVRDDGGNVTHWIAIQRDITERKRLEMEILEISNREQCRIGQDLHDGLGQHLAGLELMSQGLEQQLTASHPAAAAQAARIAGHVRDAIAQTRALARGLSPVELDAGGLMAALQELAATTRALFRVDCRFECAAAVPLANNSVATHLYRIAQEAVNNAVRHGKPKRVVIALRRARGQTRLRIQDDGAGLGLAAPAAAGMGLRIMRYRAGVLGAALEIRDAKGGGTVVLCTLKTPGERNACA